MCTIPKACQCGDKDASCLTKEDALFPHCHQCHCVTSRRREVSNLKGDRVD
jgi:hypothetical protein